MKKSRTVAHPAAVESPRHLPLVDLLVDARTELFELAVRSGLKVLETMLEEDRTALCGPRYAHLAERRASRAGTVSSEVVLGGRKVAVRRPRVRADGPGGAAAHVPGDGRCRPVESARRRADAGGRRHAALCAEPGARAGDDDEPGHEQERGESPLRGEDRGAVGGVADRRRSRRSTWSAC